MCALYWLNNIAFSAIIFNTKMHPCPQGSDSLLSPKQAEQRRIRTLALQKIDNEIESILSLNLKQQSQYQSFARQLAEIQKQYREENQELREQLRNLMRKYSDLQALYLATKEQLEGNVLMLEPLLAQKVEKQREISKLKTMVRNQEGLIDEYRKNLAEQIELQRELMRATLQQQRAKLQRQFNHALLQMERTHQEKSKKMVREVKAKDYHGECHQFRKYLQSNKQNHLLKKSPSYAHKLASGYSTTDQQPKDPPSKHNQAVFFA